jgi:hypothetical protein
MSEHEVMVLAEPLEQAPVKTYVLNLASGMGAVRASFDADASAVDFLNALQAAPRSAPLIEQQLNDLCHRAEQSLASSLTLVERAAVLASTLLGFVYAPPIPVVSEEDVGCIPSAQHRPGLDEDETQDAP